MIINKGAEILSDTGVGIKKGDELDVVRSLGQTNRNVPPPFLSNGLADFRVRRMSNNNIEDKQWSGSAKRHQLPTNSQ